MQFASICLCAEAERFPMLVRRKVAMLCAVTVVFEKVIKSCLLLPAALPGLINTFWTDSLNVPAIIFYDVATKVLDTEVFPQHNMVDLNSGITLFVLFSLQKPLRWKNINTHTHTHTHTQTHIHTHTHTHSHSYYNHVIIFWECFKFDWLLVITWYIRVASQVAKQLKI